MLDLGIKFIRNLICIRTHSNTQRCKLEIYGAIENAQVLRIIRKGFPIKEQ